MLNRFARATVGRILSPLAALLVRLGVSPDVVTIIGTLGVCFGALGFLPRGELFWGVIIVTAFVFSDALDGTMARLSGRSSQWGAFLDSTLDRLADACIFGGLVLWFARGGDDLLAMGLALACLILGMLVSYAKARAEGLGFTADVGIAERSERLVVVLLATGFVGIGVPSVVLTVVLGLLAVASGFTVFQRMSEVRRQAIAAAG